MHTVIARRSRSKFTVIANKVKQSRIFSKKLIYYRFSGEVAEWSKAVDSKSAGRREVSRGFESHPLRHESYIVFRISWKDLKRIIPWGFEANPNVSSGRKVSIANGSEGGRLRRVTARWIKSAWVVTGARRWAPWAERRGRRNPSLSAMNRISYCVCRISQEKKQRDKNVGFEAEPVSLVFTSN